MSEHKLKPCPFCGSPAKLEELGDHHGPYFNLGCSNEKCPANNMFYTWTEEEGSVEDAVALWNRRAHAQTQPPWIKLIINTCACPPIDKCVREGTIDPTNCALRKQCWLAYLKETYDWERVEGL